MIADRCVDPLAGARLAAAASEQALMEPVFLVCLGSRNLGDALERLARYKRTLSPERLDVTRAGKSGVAILYHWPTAPRPVPPILVEAELAFLLGLVRAALGGGVLGAAVDLTRPAGDAASFGHLLGAEVRFGATTGTLRFPARLLETPFATFSPSLLAALEPALEAERSRSKGPDIVARLQAALQQRLAHGLNRSGACGFLKSIVASAPVGARPTRRDSCSTDSPQLGRWVSGDRRGSGGFRRCSFLR